MTTAPHRIRIIGGQYKHKTIPVLSQAGLRPTPDSVRETVFNWIGGYVQDALVLDLFAGTGILGFEALSRGAHQLYLVEKNPMVAENLRTVAAGFGNHIRIFNQAAEEFLTNATASFDLVFLDPPYASNLLQQCLPLLLEKNLLKDSSLLYVEMQVGNNLMIPGFKILRELSQGQVKYALWQKNNLW